MSRRRGYGWGVAWCAGVTILAAGCGLGAGPTPGPVRLSISDDFGHRRLRELSSPHVQGQDTVMRLLQRNARVDTRYGGGFVQSIDGRAGGQSRGRPLDWFYYVNGIQAPRGAAATRLHGGDRVWWDRHDWGATVSPIAVVGSFPEPFVHGRDGHRLPVRVECARPGADDCRLVQARLTALGVPAGESVLGTGSGTATLRVLVGPWAALRTDALAARLEEGPRASGIYTRPSVLGKTFAVLGPTGRVTRTLGAGTGIVAALGTGDQSPLWLVTGTDAGGVSAAAGAFDERHLRGRFALAVGAAGPRSLPEVG